MYQMYLSHYGVKGMKWGKRKRKDDLKTYLGYMSKHYTRNDLNTNLPRNDVMAEKMGWRKLSAQESALHQYSTQDGVPNSKWVSPDGHKEVVFTGKGRNQHITTDPRDVGTYNYYDPIKNPIGHTVADVVPYMLLGNESGDTTTLYSRSVAGVKNTLLSDSKHKDTGKAAVDKILGRAK